MNNPRQWTGAGNDNAEVELQADVMRFVAILALCLVAISSLVEQTVTADPDELDTTPVESTAAAILEPEVALPPTPPEPGSDEINDDKINESILVTTSVSPTPPPPSSTRVADAGVVTLPAAEVRAARPLLPTPRPAAATPQPASSAQSVRPPAAPRVAQLTPQTKPEQTKPEPAASPTQAPQTTSPQPERRGFTLRFDSDAAMLRLVSRGEAGVFLIDGGKAWQLGFGDAGAQFAQSPAPAQFHAIAADTVPRLLRVAARRDTQNADAVWGVTLPERTARQLAGLLRAHDHGDLVIDSRGRITLEQGDDA